MPSTDRGAGGHRPQTEKDGIWVSSSIFLAELKVQWHTLSRRLANVEIDVLLFVALGMLLSPQHQQKGWKFREDSFCAMDLRVTSGTESDHQMQNGPARLSMVDAGIGRTAHPAGIPIAL
jgi:hypothetical protein